MRCGATQAITDASTGRDNCGQYMLPPRCGVCGWVPDDDDDDVPFIVDDDTDLFVPDPPGGESGE